MEMWVKCLPHRDLLLGHPITKKVLHSSLLLDYQPQGQTSPN